MVNEVILEGIKRAIQNGDSLKNAMMSFYGAGYPKNDIEDAARAYQLEIYHNSGGANSNQPITTTQIQNNKEVKKENNVDKIVPKTPQKVSAYEEKSKKPASKGKGLIIFLSVTVTILILLLITALIFSGSIIDFFNKVF